MREIKITKNDAGQRLDRFLRKYLDKASLNFLYKQIRKKNIVVNGEKKSEDYMLEEGDNIRIFFSEDTIKKFRTVKNFSKNGGELKIIYEDENFVFINKPAGILSHSTKKNGYEKNIVDLFIGYLIDKEEYNPRLSSTFTPAICNRLDRNTSGIVIGAKNYFALKAMNEAIRNRCVKKYYNTIVDGKFEEKIDSEAVIDKSENMNISSVHKSGEGKKIRTVFEPIKTNGKNTLLKIELITGRTHQIRAHLNYLGKFIIGDNKYGKKEVNKYFKEKYNLNHQLLHCEEIIIDGMNGDFEYLNKKEIHAPYPLQFKKILEGENLCL